MATSKKQAKVIEALERKMKQRRDDEVCRAIWFGRLGSPYYGERSVQAGTLDPFLSLVARSV